MCIIKVHYRALTYISLNELLFPFRECLGYSDDVIYTEVVEIFSVMCNVLLIENMICGGERRTKISTLQCDVIFIFLHRKQKLITMRLVV